MAARRVRVYGHGDARVVAPETSEDDAAGGKTAAQEEGGVCGPSAGVEGRGPPLSLQVVVFRALGARPCGPVRHSDPSRCIVTVLL